MNFLWNNAPDEYDYIRHTYRKIHYHYKRGFDGDGPDSYFLARELEDLSKRFRWMYRGTGIQQFAALADQLKYMGRDVQVGPRRLRYRTMPKEWYRPWNLLLDFVDHD
jgi:hypothetical protein